MEENVPVSNLAESNLAEIEIPDMRRDNETIAIPRENVALLGDLDLGYAVLERILESTHPHVHRTDPTDPVHFYDAEGNELNPRIATVFPHHDSQRKFGLFASLIRKLSPAYSDGSFTEYDLPQGKTALAVFYEGYKKRDLESHIRLGEEVARHFGIITGDKSLIEACEDWIKLKREQRKHPYLTWKHSLDQLQFDDAPGNEGFTLMCHAIEELSRKYQFYTAFARAILQQPDLILVCDPKESFHNHGEVFEKVIAAAKNYSGCGVVYATNNSGIKRHVDTTITLE